MAKLKPANENPWYVLMTLYGEQEGDEIDRELAVKNRKVWNSWSCQGLGEIERAQVCASSKVEVAETQSWDEIEAKVQQLHRSEMRKRNGADFPYSGFPDFKEIVKLSEIEFSNELVLESFIFTRAADFHQATFRQSTKFFSATFAQPAFFDSATFMQIAYFDEVTFTRAAFFNSATFTQAAYFHSVKFTQAAYFTLATFTKIADFNSATFDGPAKFVDADFGVRGSDFICVPVFTETTFAKLVSFRKADFVTHYPVMEGTAFLAKVVVTANKEFWPPMDQVLLDNVDEGAKHIPTKEVAKESCSTLRHEIGRQGLPEEEHFFFRREMEFAGQIGPMSRRLPYRVFGAVSNYGESIAAPITLLIGLWLIPALIYLPYFAWIGTMGDTPWTGLQGFALSFSNIFTFFGFQRLYFDIDLVRALPAVLQVMGAAQTVLALPLLFFLGLGLRKRFRLR